MWLVIPFRRLIAPVNISAKTSYFFPTSIFYFLISSFFLLNYGLFFIPEGLKVFVKCLPLINCNRIKGVTVFISISILFYKKN